MGYVGSLPSWDCTSPPPPALLPGGTLDLTGSPTGAAFAAWSDYDATNPSQRITHQRENHVEANVYCYSSPGTNIKVEVQEIGWCNQANGETCGGSARRSHGTIDIDDYRSGGSNTFVWCLRVEDGDATQSCQASFPQASYVGVANTKSDAAGHFRGASSGVQA